MFAEEWIAWPVGWWGWLQVLYLLGLLSRIWYKQYFFNWFKEGVAGSTLAQAGAVVLIGGFITTDLQYEMLFLYLKGRYAIEAWKHGGWTRDFVIAMLSIIALLLIVFI